MKKFNKVYHMDITIFIVFIFIFMINLIINKQNLLGLLLILLTILITMFLYLFGGIVNNDINQMSKSKKYRLMLMLGIINIINALVVLFWIFIYSFIGHFINNFNIGTLHDYFMVGLPILVFAMNLQTLTFKRLNN